MKITGVADSKNILFAEIVSIYIMEVLAKKRMPLGTNFEKVGKKYFGQYSINQHKSNNQIYNEPVLLIPKYSFHRRRTKSPENTEILIFFPAVNGS